MSVVRMFMVYKVECWSRDATLSSIIAYPILGLHLDFCFCLLLCLMLSHLFSSPRSCPCIDEVTLTPIWQSIFGILGLFCKGYKGCTYGIFLRFVNKGYQGLYLQEFWSLGFKAEKHW